VGTGEGRHAGERSLARSPVLSRRSDLTPQANPRIGLFLLAQFALISEGLTP
jgi:hypothetical protein